jgi:hypothetical protein
MLEDWGLIPGKGRKFCKCTVPRTLLELAKPHFNLYLSGERLDCETSFQSSARRKHAWSHTSVLPRCTNELNTCTPLRFVLHEILAIGKDFKATTRIMK